MNANKLLIHKANLQAGIKLHLNSKTNFLYFYFLRIAYTSKNFTGKHIRIFLPGLTYQKRRMEKILIIDDDIDLTTIIQMVLKEKGYHVATASYEAQAYEQVDSFKPDLILLDVLLSGTDGRFICRQLKENETSRHIPIIIFSGHPSAQDNIWNFGADDFLSKPFRETDLLEKIQSHLPHKVD